MYWFFGICGLVLVLLSTGLHWPPTPPIRSARADGEDFPLGADLFGRSFILAGRFRHAHAAGALNPRWRLEERR